MNRFVFTLETDNIEALESVEFNFVDKREYEQKMSTIYDDEGRVVKVISTYSYTDEEKE